MKTLLLISIVCASFQMLVSLWYLLFTNLGKTSIKINDEIFGKWYTPFVYTATAICYAAFIYFEWYYLTISCSIVTVIMTFAYAGIWKYMGLHYTIEK